MTARPKRSPHEGESQKVLKPTAVRMICGTMTFIMYRLFFVCLIICLCFVFGCEYGKKRGRFVKALRAPTPKNQTHTATTTTLQPNNAQVLALEHDVDEDDRPVALVGAAGVRGVRVALGLFWFVGWLVDFC